MRWHRLSGLEKKTYGYRERNETKRVAFVAQLATIPMSQRVYVDESGMDERDDYGYGWCERGKRFEALRLGRRTGRINMIAAYSDRQLSAAFTVEGACNRVVFETWLETCLLPTLQPGLVVILDNATFHHGGRIAELIESLALRAQIQSMPVGHTLNLNFEFKNGRLDVVCCIYHHYL